MASMSRSRIGSGGRMATNRRCMSADLNQKRSGFFPSREFDAYSGPGENAMLTVGLAFLALVSGQSMPKDYPQQTPNLGGPDNLMVHQTEDQEDQARRFADEFSRCLASS